MPIVSSDKIQTATSVTNKTYFILITKFTFFTFGCWLQSPIINNKYYSNYVATCF